MDIVEQIAKSVLPKVLSNPEAQTKESGLVGQFIALFATKIAGSEGLSLSANETGASIIQSVFPQAEERGELITKLAEVHDVDETTTQGLLAKAAPLVTGELNTLAGGTPLQAYLKEHLSLLGTKLPSWATNLIPTSLLGVLGVAGAGVAAVSGKAADIAGGAVDAVGDVAGGAVDAGKAVVGGTLDAGKAVVGGTVDAVSSVAGGAADLAGSAVDKVGDVAGGAADLAGDAVGKVGDLGAGAAGAVAGAAGATAAAGGGLLKKLLPLVGLIALGIIAFLLLKSCNKEKVPAVTDEMAHVETADANAADTNDAAALNEAGLSDEANLDDANLNISTGEGDELYTCNGHVGNQSLKDKIVGAVTNVFGSAEKCDSLNVDESYKTTLANEDKIQEALEAAKAVPNASLAINGTNIAVDAKDPAARAALVEKLKGILPDYTISEAAPLNEEEVVAKGIEGSLAALGKLDNSASGSQIAKALNIQVINFATGKFEIPAKNKVVLDKAAELLTGNAAAKLAIIGHTDSTGDEAKNVTLSNDRANAVKEYLVSKGAAAENLVSKGMGSATPVATNATKAGRFQNRRISFDADANTFSEMMQGAASAVAGAAGAVVDGAANVAGAAADATAGAGSAVVQGAADAANATVDAGAAVVKGAADATVDAGKAVVGAAAAGTAAVANEVAEGAETLEGAMIEE